MVSGNSKPTVYLSTCISATAVDSSRATMRLIKIEGYCVKHGYKDMYYLRK